VSLTVVWHPPAREDLRHIPWQDAAWVCAEIDRLARDGVGDVRATTFATGERRYRLFLPGVRVLITFDRPGRLLHVWRVMRSTRP
jgi:hypothetical protein